MLPGGRTGASSTTFVTSTRDPFGVKGCEVVAVGGGGQFTSFVPKGLVRGGRR